MYGCWNFWVECQGSEGLSHHYDVAGSDLQFLRIGVRTVVKLNVVVIWSPINLENITPVFNPPLPNPTQTNRCKYTRVGGDLYERCTGPRTEQLVVYQRQSQTTCVMELGTMYNVDPLALKTHCGDNCLSTMGKVRWLDCFLPAVGIFFTTPARTRHRSLSSERATLSPTAGTSRPRITIPLQLDRLRKILLDSVIDLTQRASGFPLVNPISSSCWRMASSGSGSSTRNLIAQRSRLFLTLSRASLSLIA
ncbi:hypothetical protein BJX70DRAFT_313447 [Aspergillus crustosus]